MIPKEVKLLTRKEVAFEFRVDPKTVANAEKRGELKAIRLGRTVRYRRAEVEALVNGEPRKPH